MENLKYRYIHVTSSSVAPVLQKQLELLTNAKESMVRFWFQRFRSGNFDLQNQPRGRPETKVENQELKAIVRNPSQITLEIAVGYSGNCKP
ncbi:hypothetical protein evm_013987 [Chilo suppressalis]|nr:hypothetical protein evm_013987 [Chilo suppressalis]